MCIGRFTTSIILLLSAVTFVTVSPGTRAAPDPMTSLDPEELFRTGMKERESGDLETAIRAFQSILDVHPALHRARLELAVAYFQTLNYAAARAQAEQVLNDPSVPEGVKSRVRSFLDQLTAASKRHTWTPHVSLGYMYDSNVSAGPNSNAYQIGATAVTLNAEGIRRGDQAIVLTGSLSHRYVSPRTVRIVDRETAFLWQSQASAYLADYSQASDFDLTVGSLSTGPAWIAARQWRGQVNLQVDHLGLGSDRYGLFTGLTPVYTRIFAQGRTETTIDGQLQSRRYERAVDAGRDSRFQSAGVTLGQLLPGDKVSVQIGLRGYEENADRDYYSHQGREQFAGANWRLTPGANAFGRLSKRTSQFQGDDPTFLARRYDDEQRYLVGTSYTFVDGVFARWALSANHSRTNNRSNLAVYSYDRERTALALGRSF